MTKYSHFLVFFLLFPVLSQIILPLGITTIYCFFRIIKAVFIRQEKVDSLKDDVQAEPKVQLSRI